MHVTMSAESALVAVATVGKETAANKVGKFKLGTEKVVHCLPVYFELIDRLLFLYFQDFSRQRLTKT